LFTARLFSALFFLGCTLEHLGVNLCLLLGVALGSALSNLGLGHSHRAQPVFAQLELFG